jgi:hypothetical protein
LIFLRNLVFREPPEGTTKITFSYFFIRKVQKRNNFGFEEEMMEFEAKI